VEVAQDQIIWWATSHNLVVAVWNDGTAGSWDLQTGGQVCQFRIDNFTPSFFRCLVSPTNTTLAVVDVTTQQVKGDLKKSIRLYDLRTGRLSKTLKPAGYPHPRLPAQMRPFSTISAVALDREGRHLLAASALDDLIFAIDLEGGQTAWHFRNEDLQIGAGNVLFSPDGEIVVVITRKPDLPEPFAMKQCNAYSWRGEKLWDWSTAKDKGWLLVHASAGQGRTTTFLLREIMRDVRHGDSISRCIGLNAAGKELWQYKKPVLAISPDGARRVVSDDELGEDVPVYKAKGPVGIAYTVDGTRLLRLPNLTRDSRQRSVEILRRASNILEVADANSGQVLRKIDLTKPYLNEQ